MTPWPLPAKEKRTGSWVLSNPEGYAEHFHNATKLLPRRRSQLLACSNSTRMEAKAASVDPFPEFDSLTKMPLQRCVQLLKRHRDKMFYDDNSKAPSSIIITTLAVSSYTHAVESNAYDDPLELILDIVEGLPNFVKVVPIARGVNDYIIPNPALTSENFAAKWKDDPELPGSFYRWQKRAVQSLQEIAKSGVGLHELGRHLASDYGHDAATTAMRQFSNAIQEKCHDGHLRVIPNNPQGRAQSYRVPKHTNYGA